MGRIVYVRQNNLVKKIFFYDKVISTMNIARKKLCNYNEDKILIIAKKQINGRGRLGRKWVSPEGGLYMTFGFKNNIKNPIMLNFLFTLSIVQTLKNYNINSVIKWPNDVLVEGKKISGVLIENILNKDKTNFSFVGVGINLNINKTIFYKNNLNATSLKILVGKDVPIKKFIKLFLDNVSRNYIIIMKNKFRMLFNRWKSVLGNINKEVKIVSGKKVLFGRILKLNIDGSIKLATKNGIKKIFCGDCFFLSGK